ncbi:hypothetical protein EI77_04772, partial [Prosthecobacter fusiformis]
MSDRFHKPKGLPSLAQQLCGYAKVILSFFRAALSRTNSFLATAVR